jgi:hypothetical protein
LSSTHPESTQASWLYVWHDRDLGMDAAQAVARDYFEQGSLSEHVGVVFHPVAPSWFDDYKGQAGAQLMIDYCNHETGFVAPREKRELVFMESPLIAFTWRGKADFKDCFVIGFKIKLGSTDPYEVWGVKNILPPDRLEKTKSAETGFQRKIEENVELGKTRVWCSFCHRMCYFMLSGTDFHYDDQFELAGIVGMTALVCQSCNAYICGGCRVALSMMEKASQVCPRCGKANWTGIYTIA